MPPAVDPSTMGPMPRATTQRHPRDQLINANRAALLSTIRTECPEVLENLRAAVFTPLIYSATPREDIVALLKRRSPHPVDMHRSSPHRQVCAQIVRWARRWHINAPWICDEAWRTLSWWVRWARWARDSRPGDPARYIPPGMWRRASPRVRRRLESRCPPSPMCRSVHRPAVHQCRTTPDG